MVKKIALMGIILGAFVASLANAGNGLVVDFGSVQMTLPGEITNVVSSKNNLILKYGKEKGRKYVSFINLTLENIGGEECTAKDLVYRVFEEKSQDLAQCDEALVKGYRAAWGVRKGISKSGDGTRLFLASGRSGNYLIVIVSDREVIQVQSDFMSPEELASSFLKKTE